MPAVSRTYDTEQEAKNWIEELKVTDNVTSSRIEKTAEGKWKAIVVIG